MIGSREFNLLGKRYIKSLVSLVILITASIFWYGFQSEGINATVGSQTSANFSGADLTGANLTEANLLAAKVEEDWLERLDKWQVIGTKEIQASYKIGEDALPQYQYKLLKIKK